MKKTAAVLLSIFILFTVFACGKTGNGGNSADGTYIYIHDYSLKVDEAQVLEVLTDARGLEDISYHVKASDANNIVIYQNTVYGLTAGTTSVVTARLGALSCEFNVQVVGQKLDESKLSGADFNAVSVDPVSGLHDGFIMGADISSLAAVVKNGGRFYDKNGNNISALLQLKNGGVNYIRLRLWNNPVSGGNKPYGGGDNDIQTAKLIAAPAKALGFKFLLCIHYSDFWADPAKQVVPKAWLNITTSDEMAQTVKNYTADVIGELEQAGAMPDMVQIGNEITGGMLRHTTTDFENIKNSALYQDVSTDISGAINNANFIKYLKAGIEGARAAAPQAGIMIHIDRGANNQRCRDFYDLLQRNGVDYDIIGLSYYPFYHGSVSNFKSNIIDLSSRYGKEIAVAETSYAFTDKPHNFNNSIFSSSDRGAKNWDISPQGQADLLREITQGLCALSNNAGLGLFYWEPAWLPVQGAGWADSGTPATWADQALFSYDGAALPSLNVFNMLRG